MKAYAVGREGVQCCQKEVAGGLRVVQLMQSAGAGGCTGREARATAL